MDLKLQFEAYWKQHFSFVPFREAKFFIATSGGIDSVVLVHLMHTLKANITIVHCNFQLREAESERDALFVEDLATTKGVPFISKKFDIQNFQKTNQLGIQEAARTLRYQWFDSLIDLNKALNFVLTAHHSDDNLETILFNFFRGTGIKGLKGIQPAQKHLLRPLLFATKKEILDYAKQENLSWVEDSSNAKTIYTRNAIRKDLIPVLKQIFPHQIAQFNNQIQKWQDIASIYQFGLENLNKQLVEKRENEHWIPILKLKKTPAFATVLWENIAPLGFSTRQLSEVIMLLDSPTGKYIENEHFIILKNRNWLQIAPKQSRENTSFLIDKKMRVINFEAGKLTLNLNEKAPLSFSAVSNNAAYFDSQLIAFPLILRRWKAGDYFYPLGMKKKKKISRFLIDLKLSKLAKENIWVVEMKQKIIWVVGHRIDDRFKLKEGAKQAITLYLVEEKKIKKGLI